MSSTTNKPFSTIAPNQAGGTNKFNNNAYGGNNGRNSGFDNIFDQTGRPDLSRSGSGLDLMKQAPHTLRNDKNALTIVDEGMKTRTRGMENSGHLGNSMKIGDSTAAPNRPPQEVKGLVDFLRRYYFEKLGIYIQRQRNESEKLLEFWKEHISTTYRQQREELARTQKLADPTLHHNPVTFGTAAVPKPKNLQTKIDHEIAQYANLFELDVSHSINQYLTRETNEINIDRINYQKRVLEAQHYEALQEDLTKIRQIVQIHFFGPSRIGEEDVIMERYTGHIAGSKKLHDHQFKVVHQKVIDRIPCLAPPKEEPASRKAAYSLILAICEGMRTAQKQRVNKDSIHKGEDAFFDIDKSCEMAKSFYQQNRQQLSKLCQNDNEATNAINEFFSEAGFIHRLIRYQKFIDKKGRTKFLQIMNNSRREYDKMIKEEEMNLVPKGEQQFMLHVQDYKEKSVYTTDQRKRRGYGVENLTETYVPDEYEKKFMNHIYTDPKATTYLESLPVCFYDQKFCPLSVLYSQISDENLTYYFLRYSKKQVANKILLNHHSKIKQGVKDRKFDKYVERVVAKHRKDGRSESDCQKIREDEYIKKEMSRIHQELLEPQIEVSERFKKQTEYNTLQSKLWFKKHRNYDKERVDELAKPVDKWRVLRALLDLYNEFKHDSVLERLVRKEIAKSQMLRCPPEYDLIKMKPDEFQRFINLNKDKRLISDIDRMQGRQIYDVVANQDAKERAKTSWGEEQLAQFHARDGPQKHKQNQAYNKMKNEQFRFMQDCCNLAQLYVQRIQKRLDRQMTHVQKTGKDYGQTFKGKLPNFVPPRDDPNRPSHTRNNYSKERSKEQNRSIGDGRAQRIEDVIGDCSTRRNLARIYLYLRQQHKHYVDAHFPPPRDYSKIEEKANEKDKQPINSNIDNTNPADDWVDYNYGGDDLLEKQKRRVPYNDMFKRYFFRWVKTVSSKYRAKIDLKVSGYFDKFMYQKFRRLPQAFILPGGHFCSIHNVCPTQPCPYMSTNKKVVLFKKVQQGFQRPELDQWRWRVFMREDCKEKLRNIFMTRDEQLNCYFEPKVCRLTYQLNDKAVKHVVDKQYDREVNAKTLVDDIGENFQKKHPEVWKKGKLKKATILYNQGDHDKALSTLKEAFKIKSLRNRFQTFNEKKRQAFIKDAKQIFALAMNKNVGEEKKAENKIKKTQLREKIQHKFTQKQKEENGELDQFIQKLSIQEIDELLNEDKKFEEEYLDRRMGELQKEAKRQALLRLQSEQREESMEKDIAFAKEKMGIDRLREDIDKEQEGMPEENFDDIKLAPILKEAWQLYQTIQKRQTQAVKKVEQMKKLRENMKAIYEMGTENYDKKEGLTDENIKTLQDKRRKPQPKLPQRIQALNDKANEAKKLLADDSENTKKEIFKEKFLFKTIMCPFGDECTKIKQTQKRWPDSKFTAVTKIGRDCPYAHEVNELCFPEEFKARYDILSSMVSKKREQKTIDRFVKQGQNPVPFLTTGPTSMGKRYSKQAVAEKQGRQIRAVENYLDKQKSIEMKEYELAMKQFKEDFHMEDYYFMKFGHLKKAAVLLRMGRLNDAHYEIAHAVKIVQVQNEADRARQDAIRRRWNFKLGLEPGFRITKFKSVQEWLDSKNDKKKKKGEQDDEIEGGVPEATIRIWLENCSQEALQAGSRDQSLNQNIEDFILMVEHMMMKIKGDKKHPEQYPGSIAMYNKQLEELKEWAEFGDQDEAWQDDGEEGSKKRKYKPPKTHMCKNWIAPKNMVDAPHLPRDFYEKQPLDKNGVKKQVDKRDVHFDTASKTYEFKLMSAANPKTRQKCINNRKSKSADNKKKCKGAHSAIELTLYLGKGESNEGYKKTQSLIRDVQQRLELELQENKMSVPFVPAGNQDPIKAASASMFAPYRPSKTPKKGGDNSNMNNQGDDGDNGDPNSVFKRQNPFRNPVKDDQD